VGGHLVIQGVGLRPERVELLGKPVKRGLLVIDLLPQLGERRRRLARLLGVARRSGIAVPTDMRLARNALAPARLRLRIGVASSVV